MAGVGRKPNASMSPGPDRRVGLSERTGLEQGRQCSDRILVHFSRRPRRLCQPEGCATQARSQDR
jgi:hypothetical protein